MNRNATRSMLGLTSEPAVIAQVTGDGPRYAMAATVVERGLAPFERAYPLGQRDEATAAAKRVWDLQEMFDASEALAIPEGQTRKILDALEGAAFAAGGQHLFDFDTDPVANAGQTPWHRAGAG